jgi:hypothetical protein
MSLLDAARHYLDTLANPSHSGLDHDNALAALGAAVEHAEKQKKETVSKK